jgi:triacylglycerol esterase/lipase EstA (alpha/beta hydrolase family)
MKHPNCKVYLVPGFFGFTSLGALSYFHRVATTLNRALRLRGCASQVIECPTQPTGSIPRRAARLAEHIVKTGGLEASELHLIGHSTGGLDARVLLSPGVHASQEQLEDRIGRLTKSMITMSTPHFGSPLASFFTTVQGKHLLRLAAKTATSTGGRLSIVMLARALALAARADKAVRQKNTLLGHLSSAVFRRLTFRKDDPVWQFIHEVSQDQGVILQLTPESISLLNALANDRPGVAYRCVATAAPPPPTAYRFDDFASPERALLASVFTSFHTLNRWHHNQYPYPVPDEATMALLARDLTFEVNSSTNDGVVPTLSQLHGQLIRAVEADHLDVVGQFYREHEPLSDWLPSGAAFGQVQFDQLWGDIAEEIVAVR